LKSFPFYKIMSLEDARAWRQELRESGRRLVFTNGCFDLLHRGHAQYLNQARELGDVLIVALNSDASIRAVKGPQRPIVQEDDRAYLLASLEAVGAVIVFGTSTVIDLLHALQPDIYVKGGDYTLETIVQEERRVLEGMGTQIEFLSLVDGMSTTELIRRAKQ
jgi:D-beta-D-heptose 7-phosphate kinase/D-beta-D-heptose 1-phosphate adenosyltransferase